MQSAGLNRRVYLSLLTLYGIDPLPWRKTFATYPPFLPIDSLLATLLPSTRYLVNPRIRHTDSINSSSSGRAFGTARRVSERYLDSRRVRQLSREALATRDSAPEYLDRLQRGCCPNTTPIAGYYTARKRVSRIATLPRDLRRGRLDTRARELHMS